MHSILEEMVEFNRKKTYKKIIYSPWVLILLFLFLLLMIKAIWGVYAKERRSAEYLLREQQEYEKMISREKELAQAVEYLNTEKGVEAEIRSKFRVVKEGESVAVIVDNETEGTTTPAVPEKKSFWQKIFGN